MFDTMTLTKAVGAVCGTFLIFLLANWAGEAIYHGGGAHHGEGEHAQAYVIDTGESDSDEAEEVVQVAFADVFAAADAGKGERVFNKCKACHKLDGTNGTGPHLDGVVDREIASVDGFAFSDAIIGLDGQWTPEALEGFLENPKGYAPGTKMSFAGLSSVEDRANLIAYLQGFGG
ncbi:cytochrome c family protein [Celeribacter arenosi]|uniref:Cytochrome c family protein n=1 Tax=Celeribacter arenosi TaxID=792649 RepID=A0ABP7K2L9_9RHOB